MNPSPGAAHLQRPALVDGGRWRCAGQRAGQQRTCRFGTHAAVGQGRIGAAVTTTVQTVQ